MDYTTTNRLAVAWCIISIIALSVVAYAADRTMAATFTPLAPSHALTVRASLAHGCNEDEACFTWATMGNLSRGVVVKHGVHIPRAWGVERTLWDRMTALVDAAAFCRMERRHMIDWTHTPRLKGDSVARVRGCDVRYFAQPSAV